MVPIQMTAVESTSYFTFCWVCKVQQQLLDDVCNTCRDGGRLETIGVEKVGAN